MDAVLGDQLVAADRRSCRVTTAVLASGPTAGSSYQSVVASARWRKTLVTGGERLPRLPPGARARRARRRAAPARPPQLASSTTSRDVEFERATGDVTDRRAVRRAMQDVDRVFHVAGRTSLRAADREAVFATNLRGARIVFEEALEAGVERLVHTSSAGAIGVAKPKGTADETTAVRDRPPRARLRQLQARGRAGGVPARRPRPAGGDRQPVVRARPRRPERHLDGAGAARSASARSPPTSTGRSTSSTSATSRRATCSPTPRARSASATSSPGATSPSTACSPTSSRISGVDPPPLKLPVRVALAGARAAARGSACGCRRSPEEIVSASLWWTYRNTKAKRELGFAPRPARGDARGRGRAGSSRSSAGRRAAPRTRSGWRCGRLGRRAEDGERMIVLYRCPTPTNVLCPCGAVARRLRKLGLEHETRRVPYRRAARPEIEELTRQRRVPGARRRRRGDPRLEANPRVPGMALRTGSERIRRRPFTI